MKYWYQAINLHAVQKRLDGFPDTFYLSDVPAILDIAKATAAEAIQKLQLQTKPTPDGLAVNKAAFWKRLNEYCRQRK